MQYQGKGMMKKFIYVLMAVMFTVPATSAVPMARRSTPTARAGSTQRATASVNQLNSMASIKATTPDTTEKPSIHEEPDTPPEPSVDMREKEKAACMGNNIGIGNTFVWASRYSNLNNYASMVEDTENPENNTCFVKVDVKSSDSKINVSDIPSKYFEMGQAITCGAWADEGKIEDRILAAKKSARTWGTVGGAVGGAAVGVGVMELFGNKLIGGKVQGQKNLEGDEQLRSVLLTMKKKSPSEFDSYIKTMKKLKTECERDIWDNAEKPQDCEEINYDYFIALENASE